MTTPWTQTPSLAGTICSKYTHSNRIPPNSLCSPTQVSRPTVCGLQFPFVFSIVDRTVNFVLKFWDEFFLNCKVILSALTLKVLFWVFDLWRPAPLSYIQSIEWKEVWWFESEGILLVRDDMFSIHKETQERRKKAKWREGESGHTFIEKRTWRFIDKPDSYLSGDDGWILSYYLYTDNTCSDGD